MNINDTLTNINKQVNNAQLSIERASELIGELPADISDLTAESVNAVSRLAMMKNVHWLVVLNQHWNQDIYQTLRSCKAEYDRVQRDLHESTDPHGARNG